MRRNQSADDIEHAESVRAVDECTTFDGFFEKYARRSFSRNYRLRLAHCVVRRGGGGGGDSVERASLVRLEGNTGLRQSIEHGAPFGRLFDRACIVYGRPTLAWPGSSVIGASESASPFSITSSRTSMRFNGADVVFRLRMPLVLALEPCPSGHRRKRNQFRHVVSLTLNRGRRWCNSRPTGGPQPSHLTPNRDVLTSSQAAVNCGIFLKPCSTHACAVPVASSHFHRKSPCGLI